MLSNIIVGCESTQLTVNELALFKEMQPLGLILFSRNIDDPEQIKKLTSEVKNALGRDDMLILIDQEGGRVSRLPSLHWRVPPPPTRFSNLYENSIELGKRSCFTNAYLTGLELKQLGINVNCAPMIDLLVNGAAKIISRRSLGFKPQQVIDLGRQIILGLKKAGVAPVIKHIPGHGRATVDSHLELPKVHASFHQLDISDFRPFKAFADESMAMSAHVLYTQIDTEAPATISPIVIEQVIRKTIGFDGLLMTDDINMEALEGSVATRGKRAIDAGCDVILHCSGDFDEMNSLLSVIKPLEGKSLQRAINAQKQAFAKAPDVNLLEIEAQLHDLLHNYI